MARQGRMEEGPSSKAFLDPEKWVYVFLIALKTSADAGAANGAAASTLDPDSFEKGPFLPAYKNWAGC